MGLYGANAPNFCVSFLLRLLCSLKCRSQSFENPHRNHQTKNEKVTKKVHLSSKDYASFSEISSIVQLLGHCLMRKTGFAMDIPKSMIKCCRWCWRTNVLVLIWVSVVLPFRKCLHLLHLGLYTVSTTRVNNDAAIVAHICYISLLRCNYYHEYLACEEKDLWTIHLV